jgi:oligopeptide/dipeptide ABC transporter ATP-binding protein
MSLLELSDVEVTYRQAGHPVYAVRRISFSVNQGETVAVVGESGCGKSSTGRVVAGLQRPTTGSVRLSGADIAGQVSQPVQMVFQHPDQSLDPRWTVESSVGEPLMRSGRGCDRATRRSAITAALRRVALSERYLQRRPNELSGGQAQRVAIARALIAQPQVIVLDEPTASLDQSMRGRLLATLRSVQEEHSLAYLFITHDIESVRRFAHRVVVMYLGSIVEHGPTDTVLNNPAHPYTKALLRAAPRFGRGRRQPAETLPGETPSAAEIPSGCPFASRCEDVVAACTQQLPQLLPFDKQRSVACLVALGRAGSDQPNQVDMELPNR